MEQTYLLEFFSVALMNLKPQIENVHSYKQYFKEEEDYFQIYVNLSIFPDQQQIQLSSDKEIFP